MPNEKRLIDANKAKFFIADILDIFNVPVGDRMANRLMETIDTLPTVDAVEVVHGRWVHRPDARICPFCNYRYSHFGGKDYNYCPNCGAKMDLEM